LLRYTSKRKCIGCVSTMHRTRLYLVPFVTLGFVYGNIGKPPFWASYAYHGITMKNNQKVDRVSGSRYQVKPAMLVWLIVTLVVLLLRGEQQLTIWEKAYQIVSFLLGTIGLQAILVIVKEVKNRK
jgi:hypothetical protein